MKRNSAKSIRIIIWSFIFIACIVAAESFVGAEDFREDFTLVSPEYVKQINYIYREIPFKITAPKEWYVLLRKEDSPNYYRAVFCKNNPKESPELPKGTYPFPHIKIGIFPNEDRMSAESFIEHLMPILEEQNIPVLLQPEPVKIDNETGIRFIVGHATVPMVVERFTFSRGDVYVAIEAYVRDDETEETAEDIKEAIDSIKFSSYLK